MFALSCPVKGNDLPGVANEQVWIPLKETIEDGVIHVDIIFKCINRGVVFGPTSGLSPTEIISREKHPPIPKRVGCFWSTLLSCPVSGSKNTSFCGHESRHFR